MVELRARHKGHPSGLMPPFDSTNCVRIRLLTVLAVTTRSGTDEVAAQVATLEGLVPKLVELELMLADTTVETLRALEDFANHPELPRLAGLLEDTNIQAREFNRLELLDLWWQEDIHSRILTWLLDPDNCHNLGDHFLKEFLIASGWSGVEAKDDLVKHQII